MQPTMTRVTVPGEVTLTAYQSGKGPDLMLLHGITGCASYWDDQTARLVAAGYRVTAVDGRGHGVSDRASDYHTATLAADAAAVIRALGLVKPTVIGHSMGGAQTLRLAVDYPELVGGIVLEDPAIWPVAADDERLATIRDPWRQQLEAWVPMAQQALENFKRSETPHWTAAAITAWAYAKKTNDPNVLQWLDELKTPVWQWLKAGPVPMLLLHGTVGSGRYWAAVMDHLVGLGYRVTAPDGRGHGTSDRAVDYSNGAIAADGLALVDSLGLVTPTLIGHSMGGAQALAMATAAPARFRRLVLEDPAILLTGRDTAYIDALRQRWRADLLGWVALSMDEQIAYQRGVAPLWSDDVLAQWAWNNQHTDPAVLGWLDTLGQPVFDWVTPLTLPITLLYCEPGRPGAVVNQALVDACATYFADCAAVCMPGVGHYMRHDDPAGYAKVVTEALRS